MKETLIILERFKYFGFRKIYYVFLNTANRSILEIKYIKNFFKSRKKIRGKVSGRGRIIYDEDYFRGYSSNYEDVDIPLVLINKYIFKERFAMLKKYLGCLEGKRILDIGCGTGNFLSICDDLNMETYGVDVSEYAMEEAKSNTKAKLYRIDISRNKLPFPSNYFDVIISFDVVEHLNNDSIFFKDSYRTLKKRGFLYFITPNGRQSSDHDSTHINLRKIKTWETLCENMKFNILESYLYKWFSPFPYLYTQKIIRLFNILRGDYIQQAVILAEKS